MISNVSHWPPTAVIHLLDWDEPRGLDVKHGHVVIPPHTRKILRIIGNSRGGYLMMPPPNRWRLADAVYMLSIYMYLSTENGRRPSLPRPPQANKQPVPQEKRDRLCLAMGGQAEIGPTGPITQPGNLTNVGLTLTPECERPGLYILSLFGRGRRGRRRGLLRF